MSVYVVLRHDDTCPSCGGDTVLAGTAGTLEDAQAIAMKALGEKHAEGATIHRVTPTGELYDETIDCDSSMIVDGRWKTPEELAADDEETQRRWNLRLINRLTNDEHIDDDLSDIPAERLAKVLDLMLDGSPYAEAIYTVRVQMGDPLATRPRPTAAIQWTIGDA